MRKIVDDEIQDSTGAREIVNGHEVVGVNRGHLRRAGIRAIRLPELAAEVFVIAVAGKEKLTVQVGETRLHRNERAARRSDKHRAICCAICLPESIRVKVVGSGEYQPAIKLG